MKLHRFRSFLRVSWLRLFVGLATSAVSVTGLSAQNADGTINGHVSDHATQAALKGAEVVLAGTGFRTTTDATGDFALRVPAGQYTVAVSYLGYPDQTVPVMVAAGASVPVTLALGSEVKTLAAFTVQGFAEGQARALNQQKSAQNLTNVIASDAFGQFPDKNIADAVKRLPGVNVEREGGNPEGRYVTIRGLNADFNAVSINGQRVTISNSDGTSRSVPLDVVSTKSAEQIEVTKALTPDMDGDGIGGAINIRTRTAFDHDGRFATAEASYGYDKLLSRYTSNYPLDNHFYEGSVSYGDFVDAAHTLGLAITANYRDRPFATQQFGTTGFWDKDSALDRVTNPIDGKYYFIPRGLALTEFFEHVKNTGLTGALDWRPDRETKVKFNASYSDRDVGRGRQRQFIEYRFDRVDGSASATLAPKTDGDTFTQFVTTNRSRLERQGRDFGEEQKLLNLSLDGEKRVGDLTAHLFAGLNDGNFKGDASRDVIATFRWGDDLGEFRSSRNGYSIVGRSPSLASFTTSNDRLTPGNFVFSSVDRSTLSYQDDEFAFGGDLKWDRSLGGLPGFLKVGAKGRIRSRDSKQPDRYYSTLANGTFWSLDKVVDPTGKQIFGSVVADYRANSSVDGNYNYGAFIDPVKMRAATDLLVGNGLLKPAVDSPQRTLVNSYRGDENVYAFYAEAQVAKEKFTGLAGVRAEYTDTSFDTYQGVSTGGVYSSVTPVHGSNDYWNFLPGVHLRYDVNKALVLRGAVTESIARASYRQLNPSSLLVTDPDDSTLPTLTQGSTRLKAVRSTNYELSAEYYLGSIGVVSAGFFAKEMDNNIYRLTDTTTVNVGGVPTSVERRQFRNADGASVYGVELAYEQQLRFLPGALSGLGVFANYTDTDSKAKGIFGRTVRTPLFGQVDQSLNAGVSYSLYGINARLAYNWRSAYLTFSGLNLNPLLDEYLDDHGELDFTASYALTSHLTVFVEGSNLTNAAEKAYYGDASRRSSYIEYRDWSANLGIRWKL
jgi:TonB-dependent receptor